MIVHIIPNEAIDALVCQVLGKTVGIVEIVYQNSQDLYKLPVILPTGKEVNLLESVYEKNFNFINLWDKPNDRAH